MSSEDQSRVTAQPPKVPPGWLSSLGRLSTFLNRTAAAIGAVLLVMMVGLILVEIVLRFFSRSTFMTDVLVGYGVAAVTFLALGYALEEGSMIRINAVTQRLGRTSGFIAELFSIVGATTIAIFLMYFVWRAVDKLWSRGTTSEHYLPIPLWIPEMIFFIGVLLLTFQLLIRLARLLVVGLEQDARLKI